MNVGRNAWFSWFWRITAGLVVAPFPAFADDPSPMTETLVFVRHGEKPKEGFGQIDCKGLNRSLALPKVLLKRFGTPDYIFAPNPAQQTADPAGSFDYVRPLATIEPTAVVAERPIQAQFGFRDTDALRTELLKPSYRNAMVFIAWEHTKAQELVADLTLADGATVPRWPSSDFDSIYIVRIKTQGEQRHATFEQAHEGLDGQSEVCPVGP